MAVLAAVGGCAGARHDTCAAGLFALLGACVSPAEASRYCGATAAWDGARCERRRCPGDRPIDVGTGACLTGDELRAIARREGIRVDDDDTLACHEREALAARSGRLVCLPHLEHEARRSPVTARCPRREIAIDGRCAPLAVAGAAEDGVTIDVARWTTAVFGVDGGAGGETFCASFADSPGAFGVAPGARGVVQITVELAFPNNDVALVVARVEAAVIGASAPAERSAIDVESGSLIRAAIEVRVAILRAIGGVASAASLTETVRCDVVGGALPFARAAPRSRTFVQ